MGSEVPGSCFEVMAARVEMPRAGSSLPWASSLNVLTPMAAPGTDLQDVLTDLLAPGACPQDVLTNTKAPLIIPPGPGTNPKGRT